MNILFSTIFLNILQTLHLQCNKDYPRYVWNKTFDFLNASIQTELNHDIHHQPLQHQERGGDLGKNKYDKVGIIEAIELMNF